MLAQQFPIFATQLDVHQGAAILTGLLLVNLIRPGLQGGKPVGETLGLSAPSEQLSKELSGRGAGDLVEIIKRWIGSGRET